MRHHPLAELLTAFISTDLAIEHVAEQGERPVPTILAIRARKRGRLKARPLPGCPGGH